MVDVDYQVDADFQEDDELKKDEFSHFTNTQNVEEISEEEDENEEMTTLPQTVSNTEVCWKTFACLFFLCYQ